MDRTWKPLIILLSCASIADGTRLMDKTTHNPHVPRKLTWQVLSQTGEVIWSTSQVAPPYMWWPTLTPDFCQLVADLDSWDIPNADPQDLPFQAGKRFSPGGAFGCGDPEHRCQLARQGFYVCPQDGRDKAAVRRCGGLESLFCSAWGCETTGEVYWKPSSSWDWIIVHKNYTSPQKCSGNNLGICDTNPTCIPLNITITPRGRTEAPSTWLRGRTWGLRWYFPDRLTKQELGATFKIQLEVQDLPAVGPNKMLAEQGPSGPLLPPRPPPPPTFTTPSEVSVAALETPMATYGSVINKTSPDLTEP